MKKNNIVFLIFICIFVSILEVSAIPNTIGPIIQPGTTLMDEASGYGVPLKAYNSNGQSIIAICTDYDRDTPALGSNVYCNITNDWDQKIRYAVGTLINEKRDSFNISTSNISYFVAELAINRFLNDKLGDPYGRAITEDDLSYKEEYSSYKKLLNDAYDNYETEAEVSIALSESQLIFSLNGDNYESNEITVTSNTEFGITNNIGEVRRNGNTFKVVVPSVSIEEETIINVEIEANKTIVQARNYNCGTNYQTLTPVLLETKTNTKTEHISGTITPEPKKGKIIINKFDNNNKYLAGAKIKITGPNNYNKEFTTNSSATNIINLEFGKYTIEEIETPQGYVTAPKQTVTLDKNNLSENVNLVNNKTKVSISKLDATGKNELPGATLEIQDKAGNIVEFCNNKACKWESSDKPHVIEGLPIGTYYLVETIAPKGYVLSKEKVEFTVKNETTTTNVVMKNSLTKIKISKVDATGKKELPGATLEIQDKDGNVVKFCADDNGNTNIECKWVSADKPYEVEGLPIGKYYLVETIAPKGYALNKEKIEFEITNSGTVKTIKMKNELRKVRVSKVNAVDKSELPGATLEIQDKDGNVVKFCTDDNGNTNAECKWVSTDKPYIVEGIPIGKYYLVETIAPKGYVLSKEKIEFEIKNDSTMVEVQMINELEVEVPDTLSGRSALLLTIAMFDVALGIGILTYVKKNKEGNN